MTSPGEPLDPRTSALRADLDAAAASLSDFQDALRGVNEPDLLDAFEKSVSVGMVITSGDVKSLAFIADEIANLRSQFARHFIPREDPQLGVLDSIRRVRSARGAVLADLDAVLAAAAALGMQPTSLSFQAPTSLEFDRAGLDGMMGALELRLRGVERALEAIEPEAVKDPAHSGQQIGLVNFYLDKMSIELALAKLEATAKAVIDFTSLGRAVEVMADLTRDFVASVIGLAAKTTDTLKHAARAMPKLVGRVTGGLRTLVGRVRRTRSFAVPKQLSDIDGAQAIDGQSVIELDSPVGTLKRELREFSSQVDAGKLPSSSDAARADGTPFEPTKVVEAYRSAIERDPQDVWSWIKLGRLRMQYGSLAEARACFQSALQRVTDERDRMVLHNEFGNVLVAEGQLHDARREYAAGIAIAERLAAQEPGNAEWQRDLSISHNMLGDVAVATGDLAEARRRYEADLAIAERLAAQEPGNAARQRDLSISHDRLGNVAVSAGDLGEAQNHYEAGLRISERLAAKEPDNTEWQRDLSISHNRLGNVAVSAGDLGAARHRYEAGLTISARLAAQEPDNAEWQRDLSISHDKLGDVAVSAGDLDEARRRYEAALAIRTRLAAHEPGNAGWQRDLSVSRDRLGNVAVSAGDLVEARRRYETSLMIRERLAAQAPGNAGWQRDLSVSHNKLGNVAVSAGDLGEARRRYEAGLAISERLAVKEPGNAGWQRDLSVSHNRLGDVAMSAGDLGEARRHYEADLAIAERLAKQEPGNAEWQRDLFVSNATLARLAEADDDQAGAIGRLVNAETIMSALVDRWPDHPGFARDLAQVRRDLARLRG